MALEFIYFLNYLRFFQYVVKCGELKEAIMKEIAKRLLSLVIVLACFLSLCLPALADVQAPAQNQDQAAQDESSEEESGGLLDQAALAALKNYDYGDYQI